MDKLTTYEAGIKRVVDYLRSLPKGVSNSAIRIFEMEALE